MDIRKVKKLIELLDESGIAEIEITEGEEGVRISRYPANVPAPMPVAMPAPAAAPAAAATAPAPAHRAPHHSCRSATGSRSVTRFASSKP
jgi:acetyl-CoA carboxylase biotin carboxyl carrier protein